MSAQHRPSASSRGAQRSRYSSGYSGDTGSFPAQRGGYPGDTGSFPVQRSSSPAPRQGGEGFRNRRDPQRNAYAGVSDARPRSGSPSRDTRGMTAPGVSYHGASRDAGARTSRDGRTYEPYGRSRSVASASSRTPRGEETPRSQSTSRGSSRGGALATTPTQRSIATRPSDRALARTSSGGRGGGGGVPAGGSYGTSYGDRSAAPVRGRRSRTGRGYIIAGIITLVLAMVAVIGMAGYSYVKNIDDNLHSGVDTSGLTNVLVERTSSTDPFYVLLMGTDGREGESTFRSDSIILARVDPANVQVTLISIPRDTYVDLEGYGPNKINAARAYGGPELAVSTVSEFAGVDISHYIEVSFSGFNQIVDSLGGVEVNVPETFYDEYLDEGLTAGDQVLNGDQALVFCRSRHPFANGDYARSEHQRMFIMALAKKILASDAVTMASTITTISQYVTTDMQLSEIVSLANQFKGINVDEGVYSAVVPSNTSTIDGASYVIADEEEWKAMMARVDSGQPPTDGTTTTATTTGETNASDEKTEVME